VEKISINFPRLFCKIEVGRVSQFSPTMKIYKITSPNTDLVYVGRTTQILRNRFLAHRSGFRRWVAGNEVRLCTSIKVFVHGDCSIELIEETDDKLREFYWIKELNACNHATNATFDEEAYMKAYYKKNKDGILERQLEKIPCDNCSRVVCRSYMPAHKRSKRCQNKEPIREIKGERIPCDICCKLICRTEMRRHKRSKRCQQIAKTAKGLLELQTMNV